MELAPAAVLNTAEPTSFVSNVDRSGTLPANLRGASLLDSFSFPSRKAKRDSSDYGVAQESPVRTAQTQEGAVSSFIVPLHRQSGSQAEKSSVNASVWQVIGRSLFGLFSGRNAISSVAAPLPPPRQNEAEPTRRLCVSSRRLSSDRPPCEVATEIPDDSTGDSGGSIGKPSSGEYRLPTIPLAQAVANAWPHSTPAAPFQPRSRFGPEQFAISDVSGTLVNTSWLGASAGETIADSRALRRDLSFPLSSRQLRERGLASQDSSLSSTPKLSLQHYHFAKTLVKRRALSATNSTERSGKPVRCFTETSVRLGAPTQPVMEEMPLGEGEVNLVSEHDDYAESTSHLDTVNGRERGEERHYAETEATDEFKSAMHHVTSPGGVARNEKGGVEDQPVVTTQDNRERTASPSIVLAYGEQPRVCIIASSRFEPELRVRRSSAPSVQIYTDLSMEIRQCFHKPDRVVPNTVPWTPAWLREGSGLKSSTLEDIIEEKAEPREQVRRPTPKTLDGGGVPYGNTDTRQWLWDTQQPTILLHAQTEVSGPTGWAKDSGRHGRQYRPFVVVDVTSEWWPLVQLQYMQAEGSEGEEKKAQAEHGCNTVLDGQSIAGPGICIWSPDKPGCVDNRF
uniref:Uncharacterized protein n=1 Tax=Toxoplasma gondii COUG TaxID=1074873 RepID=A0A2G8XYS4_TOXGO|nr:hypothetical protein TGCOUG_286670 [Toxoplasma gondii COUG]